MSNYNNELQSNNTILQEILSTVNALPKKEPGLNFTIKAYPTEEALLADTPAENTIGVITEHEITNYYFTSAQPEVMSEGEIWVYTGTISAGAFNASKTGNLTVYPMSVNQMIDGVLVKVSAKTYKDGSWTNWQCYLYNAGDECISLTGGWVDKNFGARSYSFNKNNDHISFTHGEGGDCIIYTANPIDLSMYSTLHFVGQINHSNPVWGRLNIYSSIGGSADDNIVAYLPSPISNGGMLNIRNLSGEYIIAFQLYSGGSVTMNSLYLE